MSIHLTRIVPLARTVSHSFSFFEQYSKEKWRKWSVQAFEGEGKKGLVWQPFRNMWVVGTEKVAFDLLTKALSRQFTFRASELKRCSKNLCKLIVKTQSPLASDPLGKLTPLAQRALKSVEQAIELLPRDNEYHKAFVSIETKEGDILSLHRRKARIRDEILIPLKSLAKKEALDLIHFLDTGCLPDKINTPEELLAQLDTFYQAVDAPDCLELKALLKERILKSVKIRNPVEIFLFLEWAQKHAFHELFPRCIKTFFLWPLRYYPSVQQQKIYKIISQSHPNAVIPLFSYAEDRRLPPACLEKNGNGLMLLAGLRFVAKHYSLTALSEECKSRIDSFVRPKEGTIASCLVYLELLGLDHNKDRVRMAIRTVLAQDRALLTENQKKTIQDCFIAFHPEVGHLLDAYWRDGAFQWTEREEKGDKLFILKKLLECADQYSLPGLKRQIELSLIADTNESVPWLLKLLKLATNYREHSREDDKDVFKELRSHLFAKLSPQKINAWKKQELNAQGYLLDILKTGYNDQGLLVHFLQLGYAADFKDVNGVCLKYLAYVSFDKLPAEHQKLATLVLLQDWLQNEHRDDLPLEIIRFFKHCGSALIPLIAAHGKDVRCLNFQGLADPLTDDQLKMLAESCPQLESLKFSSSDHITDAGMIALGKHAHKLKYLTLQFANISDPCLQYLPKSLVFLTLGYCNKISAEAVREMRQFFPNVTVLAHRKDTLGRTVYY